MKMKVKKIRNIEKDVCCHEQVIAYNFAFCWKYNFMEALEEYAGNELAISDKLFRIENLVVEHILNGKEYGEDFSKCNIDAIMVAFRQGFRKYCENGGKIFRNYEDVGNAFPIPYEIY